MLREGKDLENDTVVQEILIRHIIYMDHLGVL